ncbi:MAG: hypothetical protein JXA15_09605 [Spirochaetales bacterium]|nr:hypothetical protein [Spirochaetales bacterium]
MDSTRMVFRNTVSSYARSLVSAALVFLSSRWLIKGLGVVDFGILSLIAAMVAIFSFLNNVLAASVSRFLAFNIGQGPRGRVGDWFGAAVVLHCALASVLLAAGLLIGGTLFRQVLDIPPERLSSGLKAYRLMTIASFFSMLAVPFSALMNARQRIAELSLFGMLQSAATFLVALTAARSGGDRLIAYATGWAIAIVVFQAAVVARVLRTEPDCRSKPDRRSVRRMAGRILRFSSWGMVGGIGSVGRDQGSAVLLNLYGGPVANASYGIAMQVASQANQLSASLMQAFAPEINASAGRGDLDRAGALSMRASAFGFILVLFFAIPLVVEIEYVLALWLGTVPPHAVALCRSILIAFVIDRLSSGYMLMANATGRIARYQATVGGSLLLTVPIVWLILASGGDASRIGCAFVFTMALAGGARVYWGQTSLGLPAKRWAMRLGAPATLVTAMAGAVALLPAVLLRPSVWRLFLVVAAGTLTVLPGAWILLLDAEDRNSVRALVKRGRTRSLARSRGGRPS